MSNFTQTGCKGTHIFDNGKINFAGLENIRNFAAENTRLAESVQADEILT